MAITLHTKKWNSETNKYDEIVRNFAEGCVFELGARSCQIMSDEWDTEYYAKYWDKDTQSVKFIGLYLAGDDGWSRNSHAEIDATEEVWSEIEDFYFREIFHEYERNALREAQQIKRDSIVKVTSGRTAKGIAGKVAVIIERAYGMGYHSSIENKLGIATSEEKIEKIVNGKVYQNYKDVVWVWARNCQLVNIPDIDIDAIVNAAKKAAAIKISNTRKYALRKAA